MCVCVCERERERERTVKRMISNRDVSIRDPETGPTHVVLLDDLFILGAVLALCFLYHLVAQEFGSPRLKPRLLLGLRLEIIELF